MLIFGLFGQISFGKILDASQQFKRTACFIQLMFFLTLATMQIAISFKQFPAIFYILFILYAIFSTSTIPVWFAFGAELTFPLQPALVTSSMLILGNTFAALLIVAISFLLDVDTENVQKEQEALEMQQARVRWTVLLMTGFNAISLVLIMFVKEDLRRLKFEKGKEEAGT